MTPHLKQALFLGLCALILLWAAWILGRIALRLIAGLLFLGLLALILWILLNRRTLPIPAIHSNQMRSQHVDLVHALRC